MCVCGGGGGGDAVGSIGTIQCQMRFKGVCDKQYAPPREAFDASVTTRGTGLSAEDEPVGENTVCVTKFKNRAA